MRCSKDKNTVFKFQMIHFSSQSRDTAWNCSNRLRVLTSWFRGSDVSKINLKYSSIPYLSTRLFQFNKSFNEENYGLDVSPFPFRSSAKRPCDISSKVPCALIRGIALHFPLRSDENVNFKISHLLRIVRVITWRIDTTRMLDALFKHRHILIAEFNGKLLTFCKFLSDGFAGADTQI